MTMVSSGPISIGGNATTSGLNQSINIELGRSATATSSLNESALRTLAGVASGAISLSNFYGKSNSFSFTISSNQTNADLRTLAVNAGWNQTTNLVATIAGGVYCSSNSTGTPGLTISGSFPGGVSLINNGFIIGMGGNGGNSPFFGTPTSGGSGGLALSVVSAVSITNNGTIGGGGGGGGGGCQVNDFGFKSYFGGAGGGGGRTGTTNSSGGSGSGNGSPGTLSGGGAGGLGQLYATGAQGEYRSGFGGAGGNWGAGGGSGGAGGGFGGNGDLGGGGYSRGPGPGGGGGGGNAIVGNGNITWVAFGTRLGGIS